MYVCVSVCLFEFATQYELSRVSYLVINVVRLSQGGTSSYVLLKHS